MGAWEWRETFTGHWEARTERGNPASVEKLDLYVWVVAREPDDLDPGDQYAELTGMSPTLAEAMDACVTADTRLAGVMPPGEDSDRPAGGETADPPRR